MIQAKEKRGIKGGARLALEDESIRSFEEVVVLAEVEVMEATGSETKGETTIVTLLSSAPFHCNVLPRG